MKALTSDSSAAAVSHNTQTKTYKFSNSLNTAFLQKTYGSNMAFCQKMFKIFLGSAQSDMDLLANSVKANDFVEIKGIAHKIKNNFTWVGLPQLSEQMYQIENLAREKKMGIKEKYQEMKSDFDLAITKVTAEYNSITEFIG